jgi:activator of Hsp90 ATPase-like protein
MKIIHHVFDIEAQPATVWAALATPTGLARWWSTEVSAPQAAVGARIEFTFVEPFNPVMEITQLDEGRELHWRCVGGHDKWQNNTFRFQLSSPDDSHTRVRFWQDYAVELSDDDYGNYNFNWGYYLESLRLYCSTGEGKPFQPPARVQTAGV